MQAKRRGERREKEQKETHSNLNRSVTVLSLTFRRESMRRIVVPVT
jgi:hypothetical protein